VREDVLALSTPSTLSSTSDPHHAPRTTHYKRPITKIFLNTKMHSIFCLSFFINRL
jgi:hypothetical protein